MTPNPIPKSPSIPPGEAGEASGDPCTASRPVLHLTNFASRKLHEGAVYSIMARPRQWEHGAGKVKALTPAKEELDAVHSGDLSIEDYMLTLLRRWRKEAAALVPGVLELQDDTRPWCPTSGVIFHSPVEAGNTLCCGCARSAAAAGKCHRVIAARVLFEAGWSVVLDGVTWGREEYEAFGGARDEVVVKG